MTTKTEMIEIIRAENPSLRTGNDQDGYTELTPVEYEAQIKKWADARLAKQAALAEAEAQEKAKSAAKAKLVALGLTDDDLKALGL
jgi:hypothetical protein